MREADINSGKKELYVCFFMQFRLSYLQIKKNPAGRINFSEGSSILKNFTKKAINDL